MIEIRPVEGRTDWKLFERLPERLFGSNPYYLPPFPGSVARIGDRRHPFHRHGRIHPFVAFRNGDPVGRIAGIINETHNDYHKDAVGFFGFFDFIDDLEVASRLLEAAHGTVGRELLRGPYNPTQNDECGLLVDGFDASPFMGMPYNPQYYVPMYEAVDLHPKRELYAYYVARSTRPSERLLRAVHRMQRKTSIVVRGVDPNNIPSELQIVRDLFNRTLDREWGFMPMTDHDLNYVLRDLKAILDPHLMLVAEVEGKPVGIAITVPNVNEFMSAAKQARGLWRLLRVAWYVKMRRPREARLAILGVDPDYRARGIAPALYLEALEQVRKRNYAGAEVSWVQDVNGEIIRAIELMGGKRTKTYRIFEKAKTTG